MGHPMLAPEGTLAGPGQGEMIRFLSEPSRARDPSHLPPNGGPAQVQTPLDLTFRVLIQELCGNVMGRTRCTAIWQTSRKQVKS